jgi:hypothetical protein
MRYFNGVLFSAARCGQGTFAMSAELRPSPVVLQPVNHPVHILCIRVLVLFDMGADVLSPRHACKGNIGVPSPAHEFPQVLKPQRTACTCIDKARSVPSGVSQAPPHFPHRHQVLFAVGCLPGICLGLDTGAVRPKPYRRALCPRPCEDPVAIFDTCPQRIVCPFCILQPVRALGRCTLLQEVIVCRLCIPRTGARGLSRRPCRVRSPGHSRRPCARLCPVCRSSKGTPSEKRVLETVHAHVKSHVPLAGKPIPTDVCSGT